MINARIQPFCRANNNNIGYFDGISVFPGTVVEKNRALLSYINHFRLTWKSGSISFIQPNKELKDKFKIVDNFITEENVNSHFKYQFTRKKIDSHLTNFIVYDLETHNTDRATPYSIPFYRLSK